MAVEAVRDLRSRRAVASPDELEQFETDVLAGLVLARASAGLADGTIRGDLSNLEQVRDWFGRPLWEMQPADADAYFGTVLRRAPSGTRLARAAALSVYFEFLELRHKVELHAMTGRVVECPIDEMNRPRGIKDARLRIPPLRAEIETLFAGWGRELATCRKYAPTARNSAAARLLAEVGLRINEARHLDLAGERGSWAGSGSCTCASARAPTVPGRGSGWCPCSRRPAHLALVHRGLWSHSGDNSTRPGAPLFCPSASSATGRPARQRRRALGRARARHGGAPAGLAARTAWPFAAAPTPKAPAWPATTSPPPGSASTRAGAAPAGAGCGSSAATAGCAGARPARTAPSRKLTGPIAVVADAGIEVVKIPPPVSTGELLRPNRPAAVERTRGPRRWCAPGRRVLEARMARCDRHGGGKEGVAVAKRAIGGSSGMIRCR